jgi:hypothetical protein
VASVAVHPRVEGVGGMRAMLSVVELEVISNGSGETIRELLGCLRPVLLHDGDRCTGHVCQWVVIELVTFRILVVFQMALHLSIHC